MFSVAAIRFSTGPKLIFDFDASFDKTTVENNLINIPGVGFSTATGAALDLFTQELTSPTYGRRPNVDLVAILITDGQTLEPYDEFYPAVQRFHNTGVDAYAFGIGNRINITELALIASAPPESHVFLVDEVSILGLQTFVLNSLLNVMCTANPATTTALPQTTVPLTTTAQQITRTVPQTTMGHPITTARQATTTVSSSSCHTRTLDLAIVVDASADQLPSWRDILQFVNGIVADSGLASDGTQ